MNMLPLKEKKKIQIGCLKFLNVYQTLHSEWMFKFSLYDSGYWNTETIFNVISRLNHNFKSNQTKVVDIILNWLNWNRKHL